MSSTVVGSVDLAASIPELRQQVIILLIRETVTQDGPPVVRFRHICDELGVELSLTVRPPGVTRRDRDFRKSVLRRAHVIRDLLRGLRTDGCISWEQDKTVLNGRFPAEPRRYTVHLKCCKEWGLLP